MENLIIQNGVKLYTKRNKNGLTEAILISDTRKVEIYKNNSNDLWSINLTMVVNIDYSYGIETEYKNLRTYINKSKSFVLNYFDKKQHQLGFFK